ncbi:MAG: tetratricopeptide repeat protein, partial [Candidatus Thorarchaeota archaeon]
EKEPPLYKAEPEFPYTEAEEDVYQEDLAYELEGMKITPEEGIPGMEEGIPEGMEEGALDLGGEELLEEKIADEEPEQTPDEEPAVEGEKEAAAEEGRETKAEPELSVKDYVRNGAIHFKDGEYTEAILEWQKALDLEPDHPEIVASIKEAMAKLQEQ